MKLVGRFRKNNNNVNNNNIHVCFISMLFIRKNRSLYFLVQTIIKNGTRCVVLKSLQIIL